MTAKDKIRNYLRSRVAGERISSRFLYETVVQRSVTRVHVARIMRELADEGLVRHDGSRKAGRWVVRESIVPPLGDFEYERPVIWEDIKPGRFKTIEAEWRDLLEEDVDEMARKLTKKFMMDLFDVPEPSMTLSSAEAEQLTLEDLERVVNEFKAKPKHHIHTIVLTRRAMGKQMIVARYNSREYAIISYSDFHNGVYPDLIREFTEAGNLEGLAEIEIVTDEDLVDRIFASFLWSMK